MLRKDKMMRNCEHFKKKDLVEKFFSQDYEDGKQSRVAKRYWLKAGKSQRVWKLFKALHITLPSRKDLVVRKGIHRPVY